MSSDERRFTPRKAFAIPVRFHVLAEQLVPAGATEPERQASTLGARRPGAPSEASLGESVNFSERGICFTAGEGLRVGDPLELFFTLPRELTGRAAEPVRCAARVVHVKRSQQSKGRILVGAAIEGFEPTAVARSWEN